MITRRSILAALALTGCAKKTPVKVPEKPCDPEVFGCPKFTSMSMVPSANRVTVIGGKDKNGFDIRITVQDSSAIAQNGVVAFTVINRGIRTYNDARKWAIRRLESGS